MNKTKQNKPKNPEKSLADTISGLLPKKAKKAKDVFSIKVKFPRLENETDEQYLKRFPKPAHLGDLGWDLTAINVGYDEDHDCYIYHTGLYCETNEGDGCFLMPRSGNAKTDAYLCNSVGLVETFLYRGEFILKFKNRETRDMMIAQALTQAWLKLPWYKKLITTFDEFVENNEEKFYNGFVKNALDFAPYEIGDRIAQVVWMRFPTNFDTELVKELSDTARGSGGFGSTGK